MNQQMKWLAAGIAVIALPCAAQAQATAAQASATFDRIRTTPAELKLHCEQLDLQGQVVSVQTRAQKLDTSRMNARIAEIQGQLKGYKEAVNFMADRALAGGTAWFKTPEGKALDEAQRKLTSACIKPRTDTK